MVIYHGRWVAPWQTRAEESHETCVALAPGKSVRLVMFMILETFCGFYIAWKQRVRAQDVASSFNSRASSWQVVLVGGDDSVYYHDRLRDPSAVNAARV